MAKLEVYRQVVRKVLSSYGSYKPINGEIEVQTVFDSEHDHYQIISVGCENHRRVHTCSMHIDIKPDCKVWIQLNNTDIQIADELMELGIAREDIVLGFHHASMRSFTEFAAS